MSCEGADVCWAATQGGNVQVDDSQPVEQILAKTARGNELRQIAVGCGNHAHVDGGFRRVGADGLNFSVLEKPQQKCLHPQTHLAQLVKEERPPMGDLQLARLVPVSAGKTSFDVTEQLRLEQRLSQASAVHRNVFGAAAS